MPSPPLHKPSQLRTPPGLRLLELTPGTDARSLVCPAGGSLSVFLGGLVPQLHGRSFGPSAHPRSHPGKGSWSPESSRALPGRNKARALKGTGLQPLPTWHPRSPQSSKSTGPMCQALSPRLCCPPSCPQLPSTPRPSPQSRRSLLAFSFLRDGRQRTQERCSSRK